jgi:N-acetylglutamate synthase-like GNAT family acetyltransferase
MADAQEIPGYEISADKSRLNIGLIHRFLRTSYWSEGIPREIVLKSIKESDCFGIYYKSGAQVGFARIISDHATFAYLADVFVVPEEQGRGLGKWLIATIMKAAQYQNLRRWLLATKDAHELYRQFGFTEAPPDRFMEIRDGEVYARLAASSGA